MKNINQEPCIRYEHRKNSLRNDPYLHVDLSVNLEKWEAMKVQGEHYLVLITVRLIISANCSIEGMLISI